MSMSKARMDGLYLLLLGSVAFFLFDFVPMSADRVPLLDFRTAYYSEKCLLLHCDPYSERDIQSLSSVAGAILRLGRRGDSTCRGYLISDRGVASDRNAR
jgi:hypothetical protein